MKIASLIFALAFAASALNAQTAPAGNPMVAESRQAYNQVKNNLLPWPRKWRPLITISSPCPKSGRSER